MGLYSSSATALDGGIELHLGWLRNHDTWSLVNWRSDDESYGGAYLFARYLYDNYGSELTLRVNGSAYGGTRAITGATGGEFGDVFRSFVASIPFTVHRVEPLGPRLGFASELDLGEGPYGHRVHATKYLSGVSCTLHPYGVEFFFIVGGGLNTEVGVILDTDALGDYGAVVVEGFSL